MTGLFSIAQASHWYNQALNFGHICTLEQEENIAISVVHSYMYALRVLKGPFVLGEPVISTSCGYSYAYASKVLKARFEAGEKAISKSEGYSYWYARDVLKDPDPSSWRGTVTQFWNPWLALREVEP